MICPTHARWILLLAAAVAGCATPPRAGNEVLGQINDVLLKSASERKVPAAEIADNSLMPPLVPPAGGGGADTEQRFDLSVVNAPATQVFMALVSGTRYSMLLPPDVSGSLTLNLKDVTMMEALDTIRELYGYEYRLQGKRIFIEPNTMKTRVFKINYLSSRRQGSSDLRVTGSSMTTGGTPGTAATSTPSTGQPIPAGSGTPTAARGNDTSRVSMTTDSDFWGDLNRALGSIVGSTEGRSVVVNPSSGVVLVRALPTELRNVEKYLKATQLIAERQVMLEAKIIDVTLSEDFQAGINWAAFKTRGNSHAAIGSVTPGMSLNTSISQRDGGGAAAMGSSQLGILPGEAGAIAAAALGKGFIGLAFQTSNFAALLSFLETQGSVSVLSSPRIATLNNQKAVLKVGTDELFVTNITSSTTTTTTGSVSSPSVTLQPYFSGISLDVTPQIDEDGNIILHVHPAVSTVSDKTKVIDLGALGIYKLPLASSEINETDSIVRVQDGNIVAIGGLMKQEQSSERSQLPGTTGFFANAFGQRTTGMRKRELVILIKPTLIDSDRAWVQDINDVQERMRAYPSARPAE